MGLQAYPDGNFYPDRILTRAQYAQANQAILILLSGDKSLIHAYIGQESRFPDLRADNYAYNALALSLERGLLEIADRRTGRINPQGSVSGAQALLAIRQLQNLFGLSISSYGPNALFALGHSGHAAVGRIW